jgi:sulfoxide reductase catalytic subunit YedY
LNNPGGHRHEEIAIMIIHTHRDGFVHPLPSEITRQEIYQGRRDLIQRMATGAAGLALAGWAGRGAVAQAATVGPGKNAALASTKSSLAGALTMDKVTDYKDASTYNNFYEFGTDKADPAQNAQTLKTSPWTVEIEGLVKKPAKYTLEDLLKLSAQEERIYRMRCVEGWSMVIPWVGYSMAELIKKVEPLGSAKYVEFVTLVDPKTMPYVGSQILLHRQATCHRLEQGRGQRIRLLLQREPQRGPPALEPGH